MALIDTRNLFKIYRLGDVEVRALNDVSVSVEQGEFVAVMGPSGSGKSTFMNILGCLDKPTSGKYILDGIDVTATELSELAGVRNRKIGFVFQGFNLIKRTTAVENVELPMIYNHTPSHLRREKAMAALKAVGLEKRADHLPNQLSGGQMQRVAIARALVNDPEILLADEPTGALDTNTSIQIMELLKEISNDRLIIMVTHNPELAKAYSTRIIRLLDGRVIDDSNPFSEGEYIIQTENQQKALASGEAKTVNKGRKKKTSMSFFTALSLSTNNLMTKKGRTLLTAFAGSIEAYKSNSVLSGYGGKTHGNDDF